VEPQEYDEMLRRLVAITEHQRLINDDQRAMNARIEGFMQRQDTINERLTAAIERLDTTQARIEALLARMIRPEDNGTEA
jgi:hypothetical protein